MTIQLYSSLTTNKSRYQIYIYKGDLELKEEERRG